ncbi:hypothetical protein JP75_20360 [Devosia riboflavina]|uniref:Uncharacterized protein n=1 Tax=Devosia riboflavina TaxID=46914 RepID=A0A087LY24_9HYPH|nr:hypothetical protein JP75_20360 [Devosia riboflavina]
MENHRLIRSDLQNLLEFLPAFLQRVCPVLDQRYVDAFSNRADYLFAFTLKLVELGAITVAGGIVGRPQLVHPPRIFFAEQIAESLVHEVDLQGGQDGGLQLLNVHCEGVVACALIHAVGAANALAAFNCVATAAASAAHKSSQQVSWAVVRMQWRSLYQCLA